MRAKVLNENGERVFAVIFEIGEDPIAGLTRFAEEQNLSASGFTAIGAFQEAVLGKRDGTACGGHLLSAKVRPTLEVILTESPGYLRRVHDRESGLALIRIGA